MNNIRISHQLSILKSICFLLMLFTTIIDVKSQLPMLDWVITTDTTYDEIYHSVDIAANGGVFAACYHEHPVDMDPGPATLYSSFYGSFIQKLDSNGNLIWTYELSCNTVGFQEIFDLAVDANGNLIAVGRFRAQTDFDPGPGILNLPVSGVCDMFLLKLSPNGTLIYAKVVGSGGGEDEIPYSVDTDGQGNIYIGGLFHNGMDYEDGPGQTFVYGSYTHGFIIKLDPYGFPIWGIPIGGSYIDAVKCIDVDVNGTVTATGFYSNTADFDPSTLTMSQTATGIYDGYMVQYSPNGTLIWVRFFPAVGSNGQIIPSNIRRDQAGNFIIAGDFFNNGMDINPGPATLNVTSAGLEDLFLVKSDAFGNFIWGFRIGGIANQTLLAMGLDPLGDVYISGKTVGSVDFNPTSSTAFLNTNSNVQIYIAKYTSNGQFQWVSALGGSDVDLVAQIAVRAPDKFYLTGYYLGTCDFDLGPPVANFNANSYQDGFLASYVPCPDKFATLTDTACSPILINGQLFTSSGIYTQLLQTTRGCDSTLTIDLTYLQLTPTASIIGQTIQAAPSGANYQWLDCNSGYAPIAGATNYFFSPTVSGNFAVAVDMGYCQDTSDCVSFSYVSINPLLKPHCSIYPNPSSTELNLDVSGVPFSKIRLSLISANGSISYSIESTLDGYGVKESVLDLHGLPSGLYLIQIEGDGDGVVLTKRFVKE